MAEIALAAGEKSHKPAVTQDILLLALARITKAWG
jgi:hypothetical protein